ncbi:hypothetical protein K661_00383, partial [Piscirickettsia salmonis LF-89 = ATCC VR-1361]
ACYRPNGPSQLRSAKNPNLPRPTHPVLSTPWLAAGERYDELAPDYRLNIIGCLSCKK